MIDRFIVQGGKPLEGVVQVSGSKNASLPIMSAALLAEGTTVINNVPDLQDIRTMTMVLKVLGAESRLEQGRLEIDSRNVNCWEAPYELVRKMRASFYVLGPLVARFGRARVSLPGGCALGPRPVDLHIKAMQKLGCDITLDSGYIVAKAKKLKGTHIVLDLASVGATGNTMMAAVAAHGTTIIDNAACEPEIVDLANMLNAMGAKINGASTRRIEIEGPTPLKPIEWTVIPDRIETGTFIIFGAITNGKVTVINCCPEHLTLVLDKLVETGCNIEIGENSIKIISTDKRFKPVDITTAVYPGFPTDLQPLWTALMTLSDGDSVITDTIYPERFNHMPELQRLGAQIRKELNSIHIRGVEQLYGASLMCSDIRAGAGLLAAALAAQGESNILRIYHLDRGYEQIEEKIAKLGGNIRRIRE